MTSLVEVVLALRSAFSGAGIPHAFGGAIALAYAVDEPRATADVDLNVFVEASQPGTAFQALPEPVAWTDADLETVRRDGQVRLWWDDVPVDLFFDYHDLHRQADAAALHVPFAGTTIRVLAPDHLAVFKAFFDRTRDWADLEAMAASGSFELDVVRSWIVRLLGPDDPRLVRLDALADIEDPDTGPPRLP